MNTAKLLECLGWTKKLLIGINPKEMQAVEFMRDLFRLNELLLMLKGDFHAAGRTDCLQLVEEARRLLRAERKDGETLYGFSDIRWCVLWTLGGVQALVDAEERRNQRGDDSRPAPLL